MVLIMRSVHMYGMHNASSRIYLEIQEGEPAGYAGKDTSPHIPSTGPIFFKLVNRMAILGYFFQPMAMSRASHSATHFSSDQFFLLCILHF